MPRRTATRAAQRRLAALVDHLVTAHADLSAVQLQQGAWSPAAATPAISALAAGDGVPETVVVGGLDQAVRERTSSLAASLFDELRAGTHDGIGITRASYGEGEDFAHALLAQRAKSLGLEVRSDAARNTFMILPGRDRQAAPVVVGSHLDSVARGGNFDGAAGVVSGLVAVCALLDAGIVPPRDVQVMGFRGEEGEWFGVPFIGARSALGTFRPDELGAKRVDSAKTVAEHMLASGGDPEAIKAGTGQSLSATELHAFIEVHIEQGPQLEEAEIPVGVVTGIRGNSRLLDARCFGEYSHCGGVPRQRRCDAVVATAELISALDEAWTQFEVAGEDFAFTVGKLFTDEQHHQMSKIAGEVAFTLDMRSLDGAVLEEMEKRVAEICNEIGTKRGVSFELGEFVRAEPGPCSGKIREDFLKSARGLGIPTMELGSGCVAAFV